MAAWSFRASFDEPPSTLNLAPEIGSDVKCPLPRQDYYIHQGRGLGNDEDSYNLADNGPIARSIVETANKLYIERNLYAHLTSTYKEKIDFYQDEDIELSTLAIKPPTFILFGKPGVGCTTLGKKIADYLHCIYLDPSTVSDYYRQHFIPEYILQGHILLGEKEEPPDSILLALIQSRMMELDVLHKGYVLEGIPRLDEAGESSDLDMNDYINCIVNFQPSPEYVILPHIQDVDLFKRRAEQKIDVENNQIYTRTQYINKKIEPMEQNDERAYYHRKKKRHSLDITTDAEFAGLTSMVHTQSRPELTFKDLDKEFVSDDDLIAAKSIPSRIILNLVTRDDDSPYNIESSFQRFRKWLPYIQAYVDICDVRKVLELNAYWAPPIILKMVLEFIDNFGLTPAPLPVKLVNEIVAPKMGQYNLGEAEEIGESEDEGPFPCPPAVTQDVPIDWPAMLRACTLRSRVDPRFKWKLSRWKNLCPVALKHGRSLAGKPEFAVGFLDKIYFLSCKEAYQQFEFNPRIFLLPKMPRSPVKFFICGHALAGKTLFAKHLAEHCGGIVIDMNREFRKRFHLVKFDYLFRVRLQATIQAMKNIDHENYESWKRQERHRRTEVMDWIERFLRRKADAELNSLLKMKKEERDAKRAEMYLSIRDHQMGDEISGQCTSDRGGINFSWKHFVESLEYEKHNISHQQRLEIAWQLFREGKLRYKLRRKDLLLLGAGGSDDQSSGWGFGDFSTSRTEVSGEYDEYGGEGLDESDESEDESAKKKKRRRRKPCIPAPVVQTPAEDIEDEQVAPFLEMIEPVESSVFGLEEESDESLKMRYPEIPAELIDSVPRPSNVTDKDEEVLDYVDSRLVEAELWASKVPPILYVELLRRVLRENEVKYLENNSTGPLSGGWIIDNLPLEADKWRAILRTPDTAPDNIVALLDYTSDYSVILNRLKTKYTKSEAKKLEGIQVEEADETLGEYDEMPLSTLQIETKISSTELLISLLPVDDLTRKFSYEFTQSQLSQLKRDLDRQISVVDSELDISADYRKLLEAWFKTFENARLRSTVGNEAAAAESSNQESSSGSSKKVVKILDPSNPSSLVAIPTRPYTPFTPFEEPIRRSSGDEKVAWTGRLINYEMLAHLESPTTDGGFSLSLASDDGSADVRTSIHDGLQTQDDDDGKERPRLKALNLKELLGEDIDLDKIPSSILEQVGEDGDDELPPHLRNMTPLDDYWTSGPDIKTPAGLLSQPDILCDLPPEDHQESVRGLLPGEQLGEDGQNVEYIGEDGVTVVKVAPPAPPPCVPILHAPSIKRKFLQQVNAFNDFWNMTVPIMNQQQVHFWEMGVVNEETVVDKINVIWDELESRFIITPKPVSEGDLYDEDDAWKAADRKWALEEELELKRRENIDRPYLGAQSFTSEDFGEDGKMVDRDQASMLRQKILNPSNDDGGGDDDDDELDDSEYDNIDEDGGGSESGSDFLSEKEKSNVSKLAKKPEEYLKLLNGQKSSRLFGDCKDYCPVTLRDLRLIRKGSPKFGLKFRDRLYYFADGSALARFNENPGKFLSDKNKPPSPPPPRICITGSPGCGQEEVGLEVAREYGIYYFNFRQRLHEIIRVKLGVDVGPENVGDTLHGPDGSGSLLGLRHSNSSFDIPSTILLGNQPEDSQVDMTDDYKRGEYDGEDYGGMHDASEFLNIGVVKPVQIFECPISSVQRTEKIANRDWTKRPNLIETAIKDFLENGDQLPDDVLAEFVGPFWLEEPFKSKGFLMVGFPNTDKDVEFLIKHSLVPEFVYILDSKSKTMRNRLITKKVDDWHFKHPKSIKSKSTFSIESKSEKAISRGKIASISGGMFNSNAIEKTVKDVHDEKELSKMVWGYKDSISADISEALYHYHELYSKGLRELQISLNSNRIDWKPFHTDFSLEMSKSELKKCLTSSLKYRNSFFESTYQLFPHEASTLLDRGFFQLSKFGRWCPVQISQGNSAVNLWNGPGIKKVAVLHRQYIYYIAGAENVAHFRENVWNLTTQAGNPSTMPLFIVVTGASKSGKTLLAQKLAYKLGLVYISEETMMDEIIKHSFLNKMDDEYDVTSSSLSKGPQSMLMADEILAYLRGGYGVPSYMCCRVMDLALMAPRAQFHGVVFDNYPMEESQLQELLERGIVPSVVVNLEMELAETLNRCERHQFDPHFNFDSLLEEGSGLEEVIFEETKTITAPNVHWFQNETQCLLNVDATQNPTAIYDQVVGHCFGAMAKLQRYIYNHQKGKPALLDGTTPLTSMIHTKFTREFGYYDSVAINERNELIQVADYKDLTKVVEYRDQIYLFSTLKNAHMFMKHPEKYTIPTCDNIPPEILPSPCVLSDDEMKQLEEHWGFQDFDAVIYVEGNFQFKWLQRGDAKHCAEYNGKLYFFACKENLEKFLKRPYKYCDIPMPAKFPGRVSENPLDTMSPPGYLIATGLSQELCHMLAMLAYKRPRFPFMSTTKSGLLYLGYHLKTKNMTAPIEVRTHYRKSMAHMTNTQKAVEKLCTELNELHGKRSIPSETRRKLNLLMELADKNDDEKIVDPYIHGLPFSYEHASTHKATPHLDLLKEILTDTEHEQINQMTNEEIDAIEDAVARITPLTSRKASLTSLVDEYLPPAYLAKDKLW